MFRQLRDAPAEVAGQDQDRDTLPEPYYVDVDPVTVPVIRDNRVVRHMGFAITLRVDSEEELRFVYKSLPALTDAYITELHGLLARRFVWDSGDVLPVVRKRLMAASNRVVGAGVVAEILIKGVQSRTPQPA